MPHVTSRNGVPTVRRPADALMQARMTTRASTTSHKKGWAASNALTRSRRRVMPATPLQPSNFFNRHQAKLPSTANHATRMMLAVTAPYGSVLSPPDRMMLIAASGM